MRFLNFFLFLGTILARVGPDPNQLTQLNPDPLRIRNITVNESPFCPAGVDCRAIPLGEATHIGGLRRRPPQPGAVPPPAFGRQGAGRQGGPGRLSGRVADPHSFHPGPDPAFLG